MIHDRLKAIETFKFLKDLYDKNNFEAFDFCGVFFYKYYAFSTNNHIAGRITWKDEFANNQLLFWSYNNDLSDFINISDLNELENYCKLFYNYSNFLQRHYISKLNYVMQKFTENYFFLKKSSFIKLINEKEIKDKSKSRIKMKGIINNLNLDIEFYSIRGKTLFKDSIPIITENKNCRLEQGSEFNINLLYLHKILNLGLSDYDIIGVKLSRDQSPIVIFGKNNKKGMEKRIETHWAIAQIL